MVNFDYLMIVFKDVKHRFFSSFLTLLAIGLGILTIFVIFLLSQGFSNSIEKQFDQFGTNRLYIASTSTSIASTTFTKGLTDSEIKLIENKPYVKKVYPYYSQTVQIKLGNEFKQTMAFGTYVSKEYFKDLNLDIEKGRFPKLSEKYSIIVGSNAAKNLFNKEILVGSNLYIKDTKFKVVGILQSVGNPQDDSNIYLQINTLRDLFNAGKNVGIADVLVYENSNVELAQNNLKILLENKLGKDSIKIIAPTQLLDQLSSILNIVKYTLGGIALVALIVGALGIINTMYVVVTEKTKDIGIFKSIGAKNSTILFIYIFQAGLFGFLGGVIGVVFGSFAAIGFEKIANSAGFGFLEISINYIEIISLLIFSFLIGIFSGFLPAYKASKINILEAIRK